MKRTRFFRRALLLAAVFLCITVVHRSAGAIKGREVVEKVRKRFDKLKDFSASFQQTFHWKLAERTQGFKGKIFIKKPKKLRMETEQQVIVTDGRTTWTYSPENRQVIVTHYQESEDSPSPERLLFEYSENYEAEYLGEEKIQFRECYLIKLVPKKEDPYITEMKVWVDKKEWLTLKVEYIDINEALTTYLLSDPKVNSKLEDSLFRFEAPEGVDVVDMR